MLQKPCEEMRNEFSCEGLARPHRGMLAQHRGQEGRGRAQEYGLHHAKASQLQTKQPFTLILILQPQQC